MFPDLLSSGLFLAKGWLLINGLLREGLFGVFIFLLHLCVYDCPNCYLSSILKVRTIDQLHVKDGCKLEFGKA